MNYSKMFQTSLLLAATLFGMPSIKAAGETLPQTAADYRFVSDKTYIVSATGALLLGFFLQAGIEGHRNNATRSLKGRSVPKHIKDFVVGAVTGSNYKQIVRDLRNIVSPEPTKTPGLKQPGILRRSFLFAKEKQLVAFGSFLTIASIAARYLDNKAAISKFETKIAELLTDLQTNSLDTTDEALREKLAATQGLTLAALIDELKPQSQPRTAPGLVDPTAGTPAPLLTTAPIKPQNDRSSQVGTAHRGRPEERSNKPGTGHQSSNHRPSSDEGATPIAIEIQDCNPDPTPLQNRVRSRTPSPIPHEVVPEPAARKIAVEAVRNDEAPATQRTEAPQPATVVPTPTIGSENAAGLATPAKRTTIIQSPRTNKIQQVEVKIVTAIPIQTEGYFQIKGNSEIWYQRRPRKGHWDKKVVAELTPSSDRTDKDDSSED